MELYTPKEVDPRYSSRLLVLHPHLGSQAKYDAGQFAQYVTNRVGIQSIVVDKASPKRKIIDLKSSAKSVEHSYTSLVTQSVESALKEVEDDLEPNTRMIQAGNSSGGLPALIAGVELENTHGVISLDPNAQVAHTKTFNMARFALHFFTEHGKPAELTESESLEMPPYGSPLVELIPRIMNEFWSHQDIWKSDLATRTIIRALGKNIKLYVALAEKTPVADTLEQNEILTMLEPMLVPGKRAVFIAEGTYHSSMDKPLYYIKGLETICPVRIPRSDSQNI